MSADVHTRMMFETNRKSVGIAYALWFFLGGAGAHRFYTGRIGTGCLMLALLIFGVAGAGQGGESLLIIDGIIALVDAFLIPGWIRASNMELISKLSGVPGLPLGK